MENFWLNSRENRTVISERHTLVDATLFQDYVLNAAGDLAFAWDAAKEEDASLDEDDYEDWLEEYYTGFAYEYYDSLDDPKPYESYFDDGNGCKRDNIEYVQPNFNSDSDRYLTVPEVWVPNGKGAMEADDEGRFFWVIAEAPSQSTIVVDSLEDDITDNGNCTLREAITAANTGADVDACSWNWSHEIDLPQGTITLTDDLPEIATHITLNGQGADSTIIDGAGSYRLFYFDPDFYVDFFIRRLNFSANNLTLTGSNSGAITQGATTYLVNIALDSVHVTENTRASAIQLLDNDYNTLSIIDSEFDNNTASTGGILDCGAADSVIIENSYIHNNSTTGYGGVFFGNKDDCAISVSQSVFENNSAAIGGVFYSDIKVNFNAENSTFVNNYAFINGGVFAIDSSNGNLDINHSTFYQNSTDMSDTVLYVDSSSNLSTTITNSIFEGNGSDSASMCNLTSLEASDGNVVDDDSGCEIFIGNNDRAGESAHLEALADNGGTWKSMAVAYTSPARGNSDCADNDDNVLSEDQRGFSRVGAYCTSGAFEYSIYDRLQNLTLVSDTEICISEGYKLDTGRDVDNDGTLSDDEIESTSIICNGVDGADGLQSLVVHTSINAGDECANGGYQVDSGLDINIDNTLGADEITSTEYICHGENGSNGTDGADGEDGVNGEDGSDGIDGIDGEDGSNGTNGIDGSDGLQSLVVVTSIGTGDKCTNGGYQVDSGLDINIDNTLVADEITSTEYICHGEDGSNGEDGIDGVDGEDGTNGVDGEDGSNGIDGAGGEDGIDALQLLSRSSVIEAGDMCESAGVLLQFGLDNNLSGELDDDEINENSNVLLCNAINQQSPGITEVDNTELTNETSDSGSLGWGVLGFLSILCLGRRKVFAS